MHQIGFSRYVVIALLIGQTVIAEEIPPSENTDLASVLAFGSELAVNGAEPGHPFFVRVISAPTRLGECWGTVESCPDIRLLVAVTTGDLYTDPALFELPHAKAWKFEGWEVVSPETLRINVLTDLPGANIDEKERSEWRSSKYSLEVSFDGERFTSVLGGV